MHFNVLLPNFCRYPLTSSQIEQAIDILTLPSVENDQETVCRTLSKVTN